MVGDIFNHYGYILVDTGIRYKRHRDKGTSMKCLHVYLIRPGAHEHMRIPKGIILENEECFVALGQCYWELKSVMTYYRTGRRVPSKYIPFIRACGRMTFNGR